RLPEECPDPHSRRAHELGRSAHRGGDPGSTGAADGRPYDLPDHAPGERAHGVRHAAASGAGSSRGGDAAAAASAKMSRKRLVAVRSDNLAAHPAVAAWRQLTPDAPDPGRIEVLRQGKKSTTYRLVESTPGGASIIAQRACVAKALIERTVDAELLAPPAVPPATWTTSGLLSRPFARISSTRRSRTTQRCLVGSRPTSTVSKAHGPPSSARPPACPRRSCTATSDARTFTSAMARACPRC